eukprot:TRINITY_DN20280_c1_g1_i1.p3 TRINITY_DN20280_c1_g1~~TRINITY_DN20280_c1_g1_i1.p3  ORF type:complete len:153 (+),score=28.96 TRINITY_DN20280_c1_g1_i1:408-866(+)
MVLVATTSQVSASETVRVISDEEDREIAVARIEQIIDADDETLNDELEALTLLVENYETKEFPIEEPDPIQVIRFHMTQMGLKQVDLARYLGLNRGRTSELLNYRRPLTLDHIRRIYENLQIEPSLLVAKYDTISPHSGPAKRRRLMKHGQS